MILRVATAIGNLQQRTYPTINEKMNSVLMKSFARKCWSRQEGLVRWYFYFLVGYNDVYKKTTAHAPYVLCITVRYIIRVVLRYFRTCALSACVFFIRRTRWTKNNVSCLLICYAENTWGIEQNQSLVDSRNAEVF